MAFDAVVIMVIGTSGDARSCLTWIDSVFEIAKVTGRQVDRYLLSDIQRVLKRYQRTNQ